MSEATVLAGLGAFDVPKVTGRRKDLAAADLLVLDVSADLLSVVAADRDEFDLLHTSLVSGVESSGDTSKALLLLAQILDRVLELLHRLVPVVHAYMVPHACGRPHATRCRPGSADLDMPP